MTTSEISVDDKEFITRSLNKEWIEDGLIGVTAFNWKERETYLSVNRESIETYTADLTSFVKSHPDYAYDVDGKHEVRVAEMSVEKVNKISFEEGSNQLIVKVSVYIRDKNCKSHAGIFAKSNGKNLNKNLSSLIEPIELGVSADSVLLELRTKLRDISTLKEVQLLE